MRKKFCKILAVLCILSLCVGMTSIGALAAGGSTPVVSVELKPGETASAKETSSSSTVTGDVKEGENDEVYDYTERTTTKTKEVTAEASDVTVSVEESSSELQSVKPVKDSSKKDLYLGNFDDPDSMVVPEGAPEGYEYYYGGGSGDYARSYVSKIVVVYEKDENGNTVYDADGKPVIEKLTKTDGTVMLDPETLEPSKELNALWKYEVSEGKYAFAKTGSRAIQFLLNTEDGNAVYGYCVDLGTSTASNGSWYKVTNLEDADYYASEEAENHIRAIVSNGYWGTDNAPDENGNYGTGSLNKLKQDLLAALEKGDIPETMDISYYPSEDPSAEVNTGSTKKTVTVNLREVLADLTEGEALNATQAAIWSFSNGSQAVLNGEDGVVMSGLLYTGVGRGNTLGPESAARMQALYKWLINLEPQGKNDVIINEDNYIDSLQLVVGDKIGEIMGDGDTKNDVYNTSLDFTLAFVPGEGDDLLLCLSYIDLDGKSVRVTKRLAGENAEGDDYETLLPDANGTYTLSGLKLSENEDFSFDLKLQGTQYLEQGAYIYTAYGGVEESQTFVGLAEGMHTVDLTASMTVKFSVDEEENVYSQRYWSVGNTENPNPQPEENPEEPIDPDVPENDPETDKPVDFPIADVPKTGDSAAVWLLISAMCICTMVPVLLSKKKYESA